MRRLAAAGLPLGLPGFFAADLAAVERVASRAGSRRGLEELLLALPLFSRFNMSAIVAEPGGPLNCRGWGAEAQALGSRRPAPRSRPSGVRSPRPGYGGSRAPRPR